MADETFSAEEKAAMKATARERRNAKKLSPEELAAEVQGVIAKMPETERQTGQRLHELITSTAPQLAARTWYGMPAYALNDKVICFFQNPTKYKVRYFVLGFNDSAKLDDGVFWPTSFAISELDAATEKAIVTLIKRAVG